SIINQFCLKPYLLACPLPTFIVTQKSAAKQRVR
ncbi:MAG: hypothetical protein ACI9QV_001314, partial [Methylophagaceae bacterium]